MHNCHAILLLLDHRIINGMAWAPSIKLSHTTQSPNFILNRSSAEVARPTWVPRTLALCVTQTCGHVLRARRRLVVPAFVSCLCAHACIFDLGVHMLKVLRCVMVLCWCFACACGLVLCGGLVVLSFAYGCYCFCVCLCLAMRVRVCCCCELGACVYCELVFS